MYESYDGLGDLSDWFGLLLLHRVYVTTTENVDDFGVGS